MEKNMSENKRDKSRGGGQIGWQTIDSAPRDGALVLVINAHPSGLPNQAPMVARWVTGHDEPFDVGGWSDERCSVWFNGGYMSHWQPLPDPPQ